MDNMVLYFSSCGQVYYHSLIIALAVLFGSAVAIVLARVQGEQMAKLSRYLLVYSVLPALVLARVQYCVFNLNDFDSFLSVIALARGGYGLFGAMLGVFLTAVLLVRRSSGVKLSNILDFAAPAGAAAIAVGRFSAFFSGEELGIEIKNSAFHFFPVSVYSQQADAWYMCVYAYEALAALVVFFAVLALYKGTYSSGRYLPGCTWLGFLVLYCGFQMLLESWRTDALFLNSLGFVRFSQALSALISAAVFVVLCVKNCKRYRFSAMQLIMWIVTLAFFALAFVCEFTMTGGTTLRNYTAMAISLAVVICAEMYQLVRAYRKQ